MFYRIIMLAFVVLVVPVAADVKQTCLPNRNPFEFYQAKQTQHAIQHVPLQRLKVVGVAHIHGQPLALVAVSKKRMVMVKVGEVIGLEKAKVLAIVGQRLHVEIDKKQHKEKMVL